MLFIVAGYKTVKLLHYYTHLVDNKQSWCNYYCDNVTTANIKTKFTSNIT